MEIHPLGPCTIIDTAGFDDESMLGEQRIERTKLAAEKTDLAVILFAADQKAGTCGMCTGAEMVSLF